MGFKRKDVLTAALASGYTFTRTGTGSIASYFNSSGVLSYAAADVARFNYDYNGSSWTAKGLICEQACTNVATQSQAMHTTPWGVYGVSTLTANAANFPDGTLTAERCDEGSTSNIHGAVSTSYFTNPSGTVCMSLFAKRETIDWVMLMTLPRTATDSPNQAQRSFNINTGATGSGNAASAAFGIINCGDGWYRCWTTGATSASTQRQFSFATGNADSASVPSYLGTNRTVLYGGAMLHAGTFPGTYIPTVASAVTRGLDICQISTPPVDTTQPFAVLVKYSLLPGASAGGPLVYDTTSTRSAVSTGSETCCVVRYDGTNVAYTTAGSVSTLGTYTPASVSLRLGSDGSSLSLNGYISEVQWWQGAMSNALMLSSVTKQAFPLGQAVFDSPFKSPFQSSFSSSIFR